MNARQVCFGLGAAALTITVLVGGCSGDTINNHNQQGFATGDSGLDVIGALSTLGCTAGKKDCVNDTVARVCPADGTAWVAVTCRAGEKCTDGDCKSVAGGATAACIPGDGACLPGNKAIRCRGDGTGYEQFDCPANTACSNRGICTGAFAVGSSTCTSDLRGVNTFEDGFHAVTTACPAGELCVNVHTTAGGYSYNVAACKPAQCKPTAAGGYCGDLAICGDPSNPANDQTKYVASCTATPEGYKWVGAACPAGQTCNPAGTACTNAQGGRTQAACAGPTCTEGTSRCAPDGTGVQTCGADGRWGASTACNLAGGERCFVMPGSTSGSAVGQRAVCGDPACSVSGSGVCEAATGKIRLCDANGKLQAATNCAIGRCQSFLGTGLPSPNDYTGRCIAECTPGQESCVNSGSYRTCDASYRWSAPIACASPDGATTTCSTYSDPSTSLAKHVCITGADCVPNTRRCVSADGGVELDQVQNCGADGKWQAAQSCGVGRCNASSTTCVIDCVPGAAVCDPAGSGTYLTCPTNGVMPSSPSYDQSCPSGTACKRAGTRSFGCIQCVGPALTDGTLVTVAEARCLFADGGTSGNHSLQGCKADNTWDVPMQCSSSASSCVSSFNPNGPSVEPGAVRSAYCN